MAELKQMKKSTAWGIYAVYFGVSGAGAVTAAIPMFLAQFPDIDQTTLLFINNAPSIATFLGTILTGALLNRMLKFKLGGIIGIALFAIFGVMPFFFIDSLPMFVLSRCVWGFGAGMIAALGAPAFLRWVRDRNARSKYLGRGSAVQQIGSVVLTLLGGWLPMLGGYQYVFLAYAVEFVALVLFIFWFEEPPTAEDIAAAEAAGDIVDAGAAKSGSKKLPGGAIFFVVIFFVGQLAFMPGVMYFTLMMTERIADDPATIIGIGGTLLSLLTVAGAVSTALMGNFVKIFGKMTGLFAFIVSAAGLIVMALATGYVGFAIGILLLGFGWCLAIPLIQFEVGLLTPPESQAFAVSLVWAIGNLAVFIAAYYLAVLNGIAGAISGNPMDLGLTTILSGVVYVILGVIWFAFDSKNKIWSKENLEAMSGGNKDAA